MKIAIDFRLAVKSNRGMARYCREIVKELFLLDNENEYYLLTNNIPVDFVVPENFHFYQLKINNFILSEQISIPSALKSINPDVLWCPYNTFPIFLTKKIKLVVTIHDLIFLNKPSDKESIYKKIGRLYRRTILNYFSRHITSYFTVSRYSNLEIQRKLKLKTDGIITPNCLSKDFIGLAQKYRTDKKSNYFFTVSGDSPSKNLLFLINIFNSFLPEETLFIAGVGQNSKLLKFQNDNIKFLEKITDEELINYYSKCKAFIFPSLQEGFGIPIIEALCCHAKVLASNRTCLPEILEDQGILFDPVDTDSFISSLKKIDTYHFTYDVTKYESWKVPAQLVLGEITRKSK